MEKTLQRQSLVDANRHLTLQLIEAVKKGNRDAARDLIRRGALIGDDDRLPNSRFGGVNAFEWAAIRGDEGCMNDLLDELENNTPPKSPLTTATSSMHPDGNYRVLNEEIKKHRDMIIVVLKREYLESSIEEESRLQRIQWYLDSRADFVEAPNIKGFLRGVLFAAEIQFIKDKIFAYAQASGNQELAEALLATGQVYARPLETSRPDSSDLASVLIAAVGRQDYRLMRALIACRVNVNLPPPRYGVTALEHALYRDDQTAVRILLDAGAKTDSGDSNQGQVALHIACSHGYSCIPMLLEAGAPIQREYRGHHRLPTDYLNDEGKKLFIESLVRASVKRYAPTKQQAKRALVNLFSRMEMLNKVVAFPPYVLLDILSFKEVCYNDLLTLSLYDLAHSFGEIEVLLREMPKRNAWEVHEIDRMFNRYFKVFLLEMRPDAINYLLERAKKEESIEECYKTLFPNEGSFEEYYKGTLRLALKKLRSEGSTSSSATSSDN